MGESLTQRVDLSRIDFDALKEKFLKGRKRTEMERLRAGVQKKLTQMVRLNRTRLDYLEKFQQMIDDYNAGSVNVEEQFNRLVEFARTLTQEEQRTIAEELTEEELALFDLLTRPALELSDKDQKQIKKVVEARIQQQKELGCQGFL
jgi:type I restriction enzyme R subunit